MTTQPFLSCVSLSLGCTRHAPLSQITLACTVWHIRRFRHINCLFAAVFVLRQNFPSFFFLFTLHIVSEAFSLSNFFPKSAIVQAFLALQLCSVHLFQRDFHRSVAFVSVVWLRRSPHWPHFSSKPLFLFVSVLDLLWTLIFLWTCSCLRSF